MLGRVGVEGGDVDRALRRLRLKLQGESLASTAADTRRFISRGERRRRKQLRAQRRCNKR